MDYQVLARKLRPKKFADLVGQEHVTQALLNSVRQDKLHHAYLLTGTRGIGKTTIARILAKSLNCEAPVAGEPCGVCDACQSIDEGRFVDVLEIDAASNTGIDNIREVLDNAQYMPTVGAFKIYIIDEVHMLSKSAFNAMLKTLEEPPQHAKFILATTDPHKVPITVLSRCLQFVLKNLTPKQIVAYLKQVLEEESIHYEEEAIELIGRVANGSMRDALSLLDQSIALGNGALNTELVQKMLGVLDRDFLYEVFLTLQQDNKEALYQQLTELRYQSVGFTSLLNEMALILKDLAMNKLFSLNLHPNHEKFTLLSNLLSDEEIQLYYQTVINGKKDLVTAPDEYTGFLMIVMRMLSFRPYFLSDLTERECKNLPQSLKKKVIEPSNETVQSAALDNQSSSTFLPFEHFMDVERWLRCVEAINHTMTTHVVISHRMALVGGNQQQIICAIENEHSFSQTLLIEGKQKIEQAFLKLFSFKVQWQTWTEGLISYQELKKKQALAMQKKGLEYLNSDKIATKLKKLFQGEWDATSIRFKQTNEEQNTCSEKQV